VRAALSPRGECAYVLRAVLSGVGIGLLSCFMCREALERGELQRVLPKHEGPTATLYAVYPSGRYVPRRVIALRDFLVAGVARGT